MIEARPPRAGSRSLAAALADAAVLWDAGLFFEVHELLEPFWLRARGETREALQGLIQAAVGYQHLANGNLQGARALLEKAARRLGAKRLCGLDLDGFARALVVTAVAPFPRANGRV